MEKGSSSSTSSSSSAAGGGAADGLKFGKTIYFEGCGKSGSPQSPAKKGRTSGVVPGGGQPPRCQVEGCKVDLSDAKAYYSRHKVCVMHSKSATVIVAGLEQRFCQQCSRFHQLPEFDQGKRSCRRRLAGHNERRRKPPPGSLLSPRCGTLCPPMSDNGSKSTSGFVMDFSSYPTSLTGRDSWPSTWNQSNSPNFVSDPLQGTVITRLGYSPGPGPGPGVASQACFNGVSDSSSALSLLSNQLWGSRTHSLSLGSNNYLGSNGQPMVQPPSVPLGQYGCTTWGFKGDQGSNPLHDMAPDLGLGQTSQSSQYTGELGLAQPSEGQFHELDASRGYDSSVQHVHWTL